jgi:hypothetical protein
MVEGRTDMLSSAAQSIPLKLVQPDESDSELVNQADKNVYMLASNLLEKITDGELDVVAGIEQLF